MKTKIKFIAAMLLTITLFNCSSDEIETHNHVNVSNKDKISFKQFKAETGIEKFDYVKKARISRSTDFQARDIESEFITDTVGINKYVNPIDSKTTYSFKIYPVTESLDSHEYYNLVYEKIGEEWNEIIFLNTKKTNPTDARNLESSEMVYNRMSGHVGYTAVITYSVQCNGSCSGSCDGFGCPTGECIKTTITYVFTGIADTGGASIGNPIGSIPVNSGGGGGDSNGIFIPNPYDGEADLNNADFMLAGQVVTFTNTLAPELKTLITKYNFVYPYLVDFCRNNGNEVSLFNQMQMTTALTNFNNFQSNYYPTNLTTAHTAKFKFWVFYSFLNGNPLNPNVAAITNIKTNIQNLGNSTNTANEIIDYLYDNKEDEEVIGFVSELSQIANQDTSLDNNAVSFVIKAKSQNLMASELNDDFLQSVDNLLELNTTGNDPIAIAQIKEQIRAHFTAKCAALRYFNPTWSPLKVYYEASKDLIHIALDVFGLVPVVGEIADLTNGVLYLIEGDGINASLSIAATVPVAGWAATGAKYAIKIVDATQTASVISSKVKLFWKVLPNNIIYFGSDSHCRSTLRKVLGLAVGNANKAHHIIPLNLQTNPVVQKAAKSGSAFHMNEALNGISLSSAVHNGSHGTYDGKIFQKLKNFSDVYPNATPDECYIKVTEIIDGIRTAIANNPNTPINQLIF